MLKVCCDRCERISTPDRIMYKVHATFVPVTGGEQEQNQPAIEMLNLHDYHFCADCLAYLSVHARIARRPKKE